MDGRIIIPFDSTTLNQGNTVVWFAQADFVVTGMDVIIKTAFETSNAASVLCGGVAGQFSVGTVKHRERFLSANQLSVANLTAKRVIRAYDNDNSTSGVLQYSYTSTSTLGDDNQTITTTTVGDHGDTALMYMTGYDLKIMTDHPTWSDNATLPYEDSYVMLSPCPYTDCIGCSDETWTGGAGYLVITGYPLEYNGE